MFKLIATVLIILALQTPNHGISSDKQFYGNLKVETVTSVYDGDTFRCIIKGVHPLIGNRIGIRLAGVDTPEMRDKRPAIKRKAQKAKQFVVSKLRKAKKIELRNVRRGKYFRIVADVYVDGKSLGDMLIKKGLAKRYYGGKKARW